MPTTRAMARKGSSASEDKENVVLALRKKPVRRATNKAIATKTAVAETEQARPAQPLSPKKVQQVAKGRRPIRNVDESAAPAPAVVESRARRPVRTVNLSARQAPARRAKQIQKEPAMPRPSPVRHPAEDESHAETGEEQDEEKPELVPVNQCSTPVARRHLVNTTPRSKAKTVVSSCMEDSQDSDDELCGPKTPLRRQASVAASDVSNTASKRAEQSLAAAGKRSRTPANHLATHAFIAKTPQTQKVPLKPAAPSSPRQPDNVSKGPSSSLVIQPLQATATVPLRSPQNLSIHGKLQASPVHGVVAVELGNGEALAQTSQDEAQDVDLDRSAMSLQARSSPIINRTPLTHKRRQQLLQNRQQDVDASEEEPEEELEEEIEEETEDEETAIDVQIDPTFDPRTPMHEDPETSATESDEDVSLSDDGLSARFHASPTAIEIAGSEDEDESSMIEPELDTELLLSSPEQALPDMANFEKDEETMLEDCASTPDHTITTTAQQADDVTLGSTPVSIPRLSFSGGHENLTSGELVPNNISTPTSSSARLSFNMRANWLKTPRMQSALDEFERHDTESESSVIHIQQQDVEENAMCIDPSLLAYTRSPFKLFNSNRMADQEMLLGPSGVDELGDALDLVHWEGEGQAEDRMSVLPQEEFDFVHEAYEGTELEIPAEQESEMELPSMDSGPQKLPENKQAEGERADPATPGYARTTIAFDARRKSMPLLGPATLYNTVTRPRTAETAIKPRTAEYIASLWANNHQASKEAAEQRELRRTSLIAPVYSTPKAAQAATPISRRTVNTLRQHASMQSLRQSIVARQQTPATPHEWSGAPKLRKYTPSRPSTPIRLSPSKKLHQSPVKTSNRSPVKMPIRSPGKTPLRSPLKTPLKAAAETPSAYPFTPHPTQPLKGVIALVEVFTLDGSDASRSFVASLLRLGARTTKTWSDRVTHVIFKDGSPTTLQKVRLAQKNSSGHASRQVVCVNSRWVTDCDRAGRRMDEQGDEYVVDVSDVPRGGRRRKKSMEPAALKNVEGNVTATPAGTTKKGSAGRTSIGRVSLASTFWGSSPIKGAPATPSYGDDAENDASFAGIGESATPQRSGYRVEDDVVLQQTAPVNKVRKFTIKGSGMSSNRRLTSWDVDE